MLFICKGATWSFLPDHNIRSSPCNKATMPLHPVRTRAPDVWWPAKTTPRSTPCRGRREAPPLPCLDIQSPTKRHRFRVAPSRLGQQLPRLMRREILPPPSTEQMLPAGLFQRWQRKHRERRWSWR